MKNSSTRFATLSLLMTIGVVLMLIGITWLLFLGLTLIGLASYFFTQDHQVGGYRHKILLFIAACAFVFLLLALIDGDAFVRQPQPMWISMSAVWLWTIVCEFRRWQKNRNRGGHSKTENA